VLFWVGDMTAATSFPFPQSPELYHYLQYDTRILPAIIDSMRIACLALAAVSPGLSAQYRLSHITRLPDNSRIEFAFDIDTFHGNPFDPVAGAFRGSGIRTLDRNLPVA
jgi:hypothetical protein